TSWACAHRRVPAPGPSCWSSWCCLRSLFALGEEFVELLLVVPVPDGVVQLLAGLHRREDRLLRPVAPDGPIDVLGGLVHRAEGREGVEDDGHAHAGQLLDRVERRGAELG